MGFYLKTARIPPSKPKAKNLTQRRKAKKKDAEEKSGAAVLRPV